MCHVISPLRRPRSAPTGTAVTLLVVKRRDPYVTRHLSPQALQKRTDWNGRLKSAISAPNAPLVWGGAQVQLMCDCNTPLLFLRTCAERAARPTPERDIIHRSRRANALPFKPRRLPRASYQYIFIYIYNII